MSRNIPSGLSDLGDLRRTTYCGELKATDVGKKVTVMN